MTVTRTEARAALLTGAGSLLVSAFHIARGHTAAAWIAALCAVAAVLAPIVITSTRKARPAMSKPNKKRFKLETIRQVQADKRGSVIEIETPDGQVFAMPAPGFWPDEASELMRDRDEVALARTLIGGADEYAKFRAAGGQASDVALAIAAFADDQGVTSGESGASSSS